ncbi:MAG: sugar transferase [Candidatus Omnitrophota bacterium]
MRDAFIQEFLRKIFDVAVSLANLVGLLPILILVAVWIKCISRGPLFYTQVRVGKDGKPFTVYKFRTMHHNAEETTGPMWAKKKDSRLIKGGKFLKDTHLDEVPQFFNVLKGDMHVVGPRPERPAFVDQFSETIPDYWQRTRVKPGIAGLSQITYDYDKSLDDVKRKLSKDIEYIENRTVLLDIKILFNTFLVVVTGRLQPIKLDAQDRKGKTPAK